MSEMSETPTHSDGQQESSSISSFVTSLLNPIIDLANAGGRPRGSANTDRPAPRFHSKRKFRTIDDNMKTIIKEQVKSQVKAQVTRILPRI
nr:hypothetical protein [Tanacetum cinerariifolium]